MDLAAMIAMFRDRMEKVEKHGQAGWMFSRLEMGHVLERLEELAESGK